MSIWMRAMTFDGAVNFPERRPTLCMSQEGQVCCVDGGSVFGDAREATAWS